MFKSDTLFSFKHTYKVVNVQKKNFNFKVHDQFMENKNKT